jgi:hypothetical protein
MRLPVIAAWLLLLPAVGGAQTAGAPDHTAPASEQETRPAPKRRPTRVYFGMWTTHLKHDVITLDNNWVVGLTWRGLFGATYLNSFGRRAFTGGIQRTILSAEPRPIGASLGFRLGFVTGYDGRFMRIARETPVLPLAQPFVSIDVQRVSFEISYTFVVVSVATSYRF